MHVPSWGGANTTAWALYKLKTTYTKAEYDKAVAKIRIYCIWYQDYGGQWIEDNIPEAKIYEAYMWDNIWDYQSLTGPSPADVKTYMTSQWLNTNVKRDHGPLGAYTPQTYISEGDTPSFLPLINNGLGQHLDYTWGGWGGRPVYDVGTHMTDGVDEETPTSHFGAGSRCFRMTLPRASIGRLRRPIRPPTTIPWPRSWGLQRSAAGGETITLDASPTTDPDGDTLTYAWWQYYDADSAAQGVIASSKTKNASIVVPNEPGKQVHLLLEVTDSGTPPLKHFQRVIGKYRLTSGSISVCSVRIGSRHR